jgi:hypothetical protein
MQAELIIGLTDFDEVGSPRLQLGNLAYGPCAEPKIMEMVAMLALGKRIRKVMNILPRTFTFLNCDVKHLAIAFAGRHPPISAESYFNACQFYHFLRRQWIAEPPTPPFLPDLAYCELAAIGVGRRAKPQRVPVLSSSPLDLRPFQIRRAPAVHFRRCQYDIEPLLSGASTDIAEVEKGPVYVILSRPLYAARPRLFPVDEALFELMSNLGSWIVQDPQPLRNNQRILDFYRNMENHGFIEVRRCESR